MMTTEAPAPPRWTPLGLIARASKGFELRLGAAFCLTLIAAVIEIYAYTFLGNIIDWLGGLTSRRVFSEEAGVLIAMALLIALARPLVESLRNYVLYERTAPQLTVAPLPMLLRVAQQKPVALHDSLDPGATAARLGAAMEAIVEIILQASQVAAYIAVFLIGVMLVVLGIDARLLVPLVVWMVLVGLLGWLRTPGLARASTIAASAHATLVGRLQDRFAKHRTIKTFSTAPAEAALARRLGARYRRALTAEYRQYRRIDTALNLLNGSLVVASVGLALALWAEDQITTGTVAALTGLVLRIVGLAEWFIDELQTLLQN
jgi:ATP-binding cassette subfamily B multidrug efflux pump